MAVGDVVEIEEDKSTEDWIFCVNETGENGMSMKERGGRGRRSVYFVYLIWLSGCALYELMSRISGFVPRNYVKEMDPASLPSRTSHLSFEKRLSLTIIFLSRSLLFLLNAGGRGVFASFLMDLHFS